MAGQGGVIVPDTMFVATTRDALESAKLWVEIVQAAVIISVTIFTARWTYRTYSQKEKIQELKELRRTVDEYYNAMQIFCAALKPAEVGDQEIREKLALVTVHNRLVGLSKLNLYTKKAVRTRVLVLVGGWLADSRIKSMEHRVGVDVPEEMRQRAWGEFTAEYDEVSKLIEKEAGRLL